MILGQILVAWVYGHIFEYVAHRYILHNSKFFKKQFKQHFGQHHKVSRKNKMYDSAYESLISSKFECISLFLVSLIHLPVLFFFPYAYATLVVSTLLYYFLHRKAHTDTSWGKKWLPWHHDHHMGKNQHLNWGVRLPVIDYLLGTNSKLSTSHHRTSKPGKSKSGNS